MRSPAELIAAFVNHRHWAVVGVSHNPSTFGHIIFKDLRRAGYHVQAVGLSGGTLDGTRIYPSLASGATCSRWGRTSKSECFRSIASATASA